jgi:hypothetical protein
VVPLSAVDDVLPTVDAVISCLPGTAETTGFLDARRIALLPEHAVLINVGRGSVVDTPALAAALVERRLRGAVLDVFDTEPLPAGSPLWAIPNLIMSPHTAALAVDEDDRIVGVDLLADRVSELSIDRDVVLPVFRAKCGPRVRYVAEWPEPFVGKSVVVARLFRFREPHSSHHVRLFSGRNADVPLSVRHLLVSVPAAVRHPNSGAGAHDGLQCGDEAAGRMKNAYGPVGLLVNVGLAVSQNHHPLAL